MSPETLKPHFTAFAERVSVTERPYTELWRVKIKQEVPSPDVWVTIDSPTFPKDSLAGETAALHVLRDIMVHTVSDRAFTLQTGIKIKPCQTEGCRGIYRFLPAGHCVPCESEQCKKLWRERDAWNHFPLRYSVVWESPENTPETLTKAFT